MKAWTSKRKKRWAWPILNRLLFKSIRYNCKINYNLMNTYYEWFRWKSIGRSILNCLIDLAFFFSLSVYSNSEGYSAEYWKEEEEKMKLSKFDSKNVFLDSWNTCTQLKATQQLAAADNPFYLAFFFLLLLLSYTWKHLCVHTLSQYLRMDDVSKRTRMNACDISHWSQSANKMPML